MTTTTSERHEKWCDSRNLALCTGCSVKYGWHYNGVTGEETTCRGGKPHEWPPKPCNCGPNDQRKADRRKSAASVGEIEADLHRKSPSEGAGGSVLGPAGATPAGEEWVVEIVAAARKQTYDLGCGRSDGGPLWSHQEVARRILATLNAHRPRTEDDGEDILATDLDIIARSLRIGDSQRTVDALATSIENVAIQLRARLLASQEPPGEGVIRRELLCEMCGRDYPIWSGDSGLWNRVMRDGDRANADEYAFVCPTCFTVKAVLMGHARSFYLADYNTLRVVPEEPPAETLGWVSDTGTLRTRIYDLFTALEDACVLEQGGIKDACRMLHEALARVVPDTPEEES